MNHICLMILMDGFVAQLTLFRAIGDTNPSMDALPANRS